MTLIDSSPGVFAVKDFFRILLVVACASGGCGSGIDPESEIEVGQEAIVQGRSCAGWVRASIVGIGLDSGQRPLGQQSYCTGTLIAQNLVLTARHCVAELQSSSIWGAHECRADGSDNPAVMFGPASVQGVNIFDGLDSKPLARAALALTPTSRSLCNHDIALLLLDRAVPGKQPARVRVLGAKTAQGARVTRARDPWLVIAGFGLLDDGVENHRGCQQKKVQVLASGPDELSYLGAHEFATTFGTCNGDSGGPVFDQSGQLVGVTSRGWGDCHGLGIFPDLAHHVALIRKALVRAQAALP